MTATTGLPSPTALAHAVRYDGFTADELALQHATTRQRIVEHLAAGGFDPTGYKHAGQVNGQHRRRRLKDADNGYGRHVSGADRTISTDPARYSGNSRPKTTGLDWEAHRAPEPVQPAPAHSRSVQTGDAGKREGEARNPTPPASSTTRCRWCREPVDAEDLVDDMCPLCRADAAAQFVAPTQAPTSGGIDGEEIPADVTPPARRARRSGKLDGHAIEIIRRYKAGESTVALGKAFGCTPTAIGSLLERRGVPRRPPGGGRPRSTPSPPKEGKQGKPTTRSSAPRATQASSTSGRAPEAGPSVSDDEASAGVREMRPGTAEVAPSLPRDCLEWAHLLDGTRHSTDPVVRTVRQAVLSALAALDLAAHPEPPQRLAASASPSPGAVTAASQPAAAAHRPRRPPRPRGDIDEADVVRRYQHGETSPAIASALGCTPKRVRAILDRAGVVRRDDRRGHSGSEPKTYDPQLVEQIRHLYVDERLTQARIAEQIGVSTKVVQNVMTRHSITARPAAHIRGTRTGADRSRPLKQRIADLGTTSHAIKTWAYQHGLVDRIKVGIPSAALVDAYEQAHHQQSGATA